MEYHIELDNLDNIEKVNRAFLIEDPSAITDIQNCKIRLSTILSKEEIVLLFKNIDIDLNINRIIQMPSICCGGCAG